MNTLALLLAEIRYRKTNFLLAVVAVTIAASLYVAGPMLVDGYSRETHARVAEAEARTSKTLAELEDQTRRLMRDLGFNLMIVHRDTDMSDLWSADFATSDMPQEYVNRLAKDQRLTLITHLVATLAGRVTWENRKVLVVGYQPETTQPHIKEKKPMGYTIEPGAVLLGYELHGQRKVGDTIEVAGRKFKIAKLVDEQGSKDDITIAMHLSDAQAVLNKAGRVNQIMALGCNCAGSNLPNIRKQLTSILPDTHITEFRTKALARAEQRAAVADQEKKILENLATTRGQVQQSLETLAGVLTPLVVLGCAIWVGLLALANVRQRRSEIGLLRALGKRSSTIVSLLLGKALLLGLVGALLGFALGSAVGQALGTRALEVSGVYLSWKAGSFVYLLIGAPLVAAVASYLPALTALSEDPAAALREV